MVDEFRFCLRCRRVYLASSAQKVQGRLRCAYFTCSGPYFASYGWEDLRALPLAGVQLPAVPEVGKVYPLLVRDGQLYWETSAATPAD